MLRFVLKLYRMIRPDSLLCEYPGNGGYLHAHVSAMKTLWKALPEQEVRVQAEGQRVRYHWMKEHYCVHCQGSLCSPKMESPQYYSRQTRIYIIKEKREKTPKLTKELRKLSNAMTTFDHICIISRDCQSCLKAYRIWNYSLWLELDFPSP